MKAQYQETDAEKFIWDAVDFLSKELNEKDFINEFVKAVGSDKSEIAIKYILQNWNFNEDFLDAYPDNEDILYRG